MSKYIDAERLNMEWETLKPFGVTDTMIENLKWIVDRQPTIEVSEDCISRDYVRLIESDEDAYFGDWNETYERGFSDAIDKVLDAPSVVPTTEQSSMVGEWIINEPKEIMKNSLRTDCNGCRFVGIYDTEFPCANCVRKNKDYYSALRSEDERSRE